MRSYGLTVFGFGLLFSFCTATSFSEPLSSHVEQSARAEPVEQRVLASDAATTAHMGVAVAIDGNTAAIGAELATSGGVAEAGAVYIFEKVDDRWQETFKLGSDQIAPWEFFGHAVALEGNTLMVSALAATVDAVSGAGAVHMFRRNSDGQWAHGGLLSADDSIASDIFGGAIALEGNALVVGASQVSDEDSLYHGAAYLFQQDSDGVWSQRQRLLASDVSAWSFFGMAVEISGSEVVVSAPMETVAGVQRRGAVYVFRQNSDGLWVEVQKLLSDDGGMAHQAFGSAVSVDGNVMVVGSQWATIDAVQNVGAAYVFHRNSDGVWQQVQKLTGSAAIFNDHFGNSVSLRGHQLLVGAYYSNIAPVNSLQGSAYLFEANSDGVWSEVNRFVASDGQACDQMGVSVAQGDDVSVVGAHYATPYQTFEEGAVYFYGQHAGTDQLLASGFELLPANPC